MEIKKSPKADLQNKRGLLLEIGLIVALALVIAAFAYTPKEHRIEQVDLNYGPVDEQIADLLQVVTNETKIATDINFAEFDEDTEVLQQVEVKEEIIEDDQPFLTAETMPSFQGGDLNTFRKWVQDNVRFPQIALENGISGRVVLSFVIEKDGRLTNIQVLMTPDRSLSEEAIRVLNKSPKWSPGKQRNQVVRIKYTLPVDFRMQN